MLRWEHFVVPLDASLDDEKQKLVFCKRIADKLDHWGEQGWEFCETISFETEHHKKDLLAVFKRPVANET